MLWLLILFIVIPAIELALLIEIGSRIGTLATLGLIAATGVLGAALARWQGLGVLKRIREETAAGQVPAKPIADGVMILVAAAVLMTPGVLTDAVGFLCLIPATRSVIRALVWRRLLQAIQRGHVHVSAEFRGDPSAGPTPPPTEDRPRLPSPDEP